MLMEQNSKLLLKNWIIMEVFEVWRKKRTLIDWYFFEQKKVK
jgi:hypothetical protein